MSGGRGRALVVVAALAACGKVVDSGDAGRRTRRSRTRRTRPRRRAVRRTSWVKDWNVCDGGAAVGLWCSKGEDCCSGNCFHGSCQRPPCTSDEAGCGSDSECCSGKSARSSSRTRGSCAGGTCAPLNATCKVLGNACAQGNECCSSACVSGVCVQPSYCGQLGDVCVGASDCCGGLCVHEDGGAALGRCGMSDPTFEGCIAIDGIVCGELTDGGPPPCGGGCCSRNCVPWGPLARCVCLPSSGCQPFGGLCRNDSDCCHDGNSLAYCLFDSPDAGAGRCSNPTGCKPNGDICRTNLPCNATDNCCSGKTEDAGTCQLDENGTPRCSYPRDAGTCAEAGAGCASSADCCGGAPCVPGDAGFDCYNGTCVPRGGACSADGDCCLGQRCDQPSRSCVAFAGGCALYGQTCSSGSDCCNGVPCTGGRCAYPPH